LLKRQVDRIGKRRSVERQNRKDAGVPVAALVGYTNTGKSTLMNALSGAGVFVEDLLFATLDPTIRRIALGGGREILLTDTVGFIRNLPHQLLAAFHATLEEVVEADVLIHVVDASHPQMDEQIASARRVLGELDCADKPVVMAFNKCDLVSDRDRLRERTGREEHAAVISAAMGEGLDDLLRLVGERLEQALVPVELVVPWNAQALLSEVHERGRVLAEEFTEDGVALTARVPDDLSRRLRRAAGSDVVGESEE
jgi:GTP-binding protein HflX